MSICKDLYKMRRDEAGAILEYSKLKSMMPPDHAIHIEMLETYLADEYKHLQGVESITRDMKCPALTPVLEIHIISHEMREGIDEIEGLAKSLPDKEREQKIHKLTEEIEHKINEILEASKTTDEKLEEAEKKEIEEEIGEKEK